MKTDELYIFICGKEIISMVLNIQTYNYINTDGNNVNALTKTAHKFNYFVLKQ